MAKPALNRPIAVIGLPASGKTNVARLLSGLTHLPFHDLDDLIEAEAGMDIPAIFAAEGEAGFRARESRALERAARGTPMVLATGGGAVLAPGNRKILREGFTCVWLQVTPETAAARSEGGSRPLLAGGNALEKIRKLQSERTAFYEECAAVQVDTENLSLREVAQAVHELLG